MEQTLCLGPSVHTAIRGCQLNSSHKCFPLIIYIRAGRWTLLLAVTAFTDQTFSIVHLIFLLSLSVSGCLMASHSSEDWLTYHSMTCRCSLYPMTLESKSTWTRSVPGGFVFLFFNKTIKKSEKNPFHKKMYWVKIKFLHVKDDLKNEEWWLFYPSVVLENSIIFIFDSSIKPYNVKLLMNLFIDHSFT